MLITLCIVLFLDGLDVSMIGVALPSIGAELDLSTSTLQWLVSGYVLGYGGLLLLGGRTADLLGRRRVFLIALAVFALASLAGGLVSSGPLLILTRFIKGLAAAFTAPTGLSIITTNFAEGPARNKALSIYTVFGAGGYSSGLLFGGLMTGVGWRWTFLLPVPIALAALVAAYVLLPRHEPARGGRSRPARRGVLHRRDAAARLHRRHGARRRLGLGPHPRLLRPGRTACSRRSSSWRAGSSTR